MNYININSYIEIDKKIILKLKIKYHNKKELYNFVNAIFLLGCLSTTKNKYDIQALELKNNLYPNSVMAGYYCPKLYWIIIALLKNDNSSISNYFKAKAFEQLPGQYKDYIFSDWNEFNTIKRQCTTYCIDCYEEFLKECQSDISSDYYAIHINSTISALADKYLNIGEKEKALSCYKKSYKNSKNSHDAKRIAQIESNGDIQKRVNILYYYYEDIKKDESIKKQILLFEEWIKLKEEVYSLMKQGKKQVEIIKELGIDKNKIRIVINYLKEDGKVEKINNKYVAI